MTTDLLLLAIQNIFTFAEVVCATWFEDDEDTSSGGVHTCILFPEIRGQHQ
jgi:hypothetical protein